MNKKTIPLMHLHRGKEAKIINIRGGLGFQRKLRVMGIRKGKRVKVLSRQPFRGPLTIQIGKCDMTIGRGMAQKIIVEEL